MTVLVTGGGGFLGGAIVRQLLTQGVHVRTLSRSTYPWLNELPVEQITGDLGNAADVQSAVAGCESVFHVAAKAGVWGKRRDYDRTNVQGTKHILAACNKHSVKRLVFTSTPSVVHAGGDLEQIDETTPYAKQFSADYPESKALAEQAVLQANGSTLATVALRPHLIWGPGDPHLIPRLLARARAGKLRRFGSRPIKVDVTFIDNAAEAHLLAWKHLAPGSAVAGKAYFISQGEPVELWPFLNQILAIYQVPPVTKTIPVWLAKLAARGLETVYWLLRLSAEPPLTRFIVEQMSTSHWYDISAARRDFGYSPRVSIQQGLHLLGQGLPKDTRNA